MDSAPEEAAHWKRTPDAQLRRALPHRSSIGKGRKTAIVRRIKNGCVEPLPCS